MDVSLIKKEIETLVQRMSFGSELESIDVHEGAASRFVIRLHSSGREIPQGEELHDHPASSNMLIGERGNNLAALEYLLKRILQKKYNEDWKFTLDVNDYRMKRLEDLKQDVKSAAKEVRTHKREVSLRPMSSFERRIVHLLLAEYPDITTESIGQEPDRRVIIKPYP